MKQNEAENLLQSDIYHEKHDIGRVVLILNLISIEIEEFIAY